MKALMIALMLVVATSSLAAPIAAQDPTDLTGTWAVTIQTDQTAVTNDAVITTDGKNVFGTIGSANGDLRLFGSFDSDAVHLYADSGPDTQVVLVMTGGRAPGSISGTAMLTGIGQVTWTAQRK